MTADLNISSQTPDNHQPDLTQNQPDQASEQNTQSWRAIQTFMKRKTHMGKKAEAGFRAEYADFFVQPDLATVQAMDIEGITDLRQLFAHPENPLTLEIGFGMGTSLVEMGKAAPERNFVGIEVHEAGLGNCAFLAGEQGLTNLKLISSDAISLMKQLPADHIDTVQLYFPDPWQKKRHYKRRFVSPERMAVVERVLKQDGVFHAATDWEHYAHWMIEVLDSLPGFVNAVGQTADGIGEFLPRPAFRPLTKFEKRGINEGRAIFDVMYRKR